MSKSSQNEGKILLAVRANQSNQVPSIRAASQLFDVAYTTLYDRIYGRVARGGYRPVGRKFTTTEEEILREWLLAMDKRDYPMTPSNLRSAANLLLQARCGPDVCGGQNWPTRYINRQPELKSQYNRKYDHQRALCENPILISQRFNLVDSTVTKYDIQSLDIYNFDETGFALGIASTSRVITSSDRRIRPHLIQQGDREWATVIEFVGAGG